MADATPEEIEEGMADVKKLFESDIPLARCEKLEELVVQLRCEKSALQLQIETSDEKNADKIEGFRLKTESLYNTLAELESRNELLETQMLESSARQQREQREHSESLDDEMALVRSALQEATHRLESVRGFEEDELKNAAERAELAATIARMKEDQAAKITAIERANVKEKEMIKRRMQREMGDAARSLQETAKEHLEETTKRALQKNETMTAELHYQSTETEKLLGQNRQLLERVKSLRSELATQQQLQDQFATRSHCSQKLVKKLHEKMQGRDAAEAAEAERLGPRGDAALRERVVELEQLLDSSQREASVARAEAKSLRTAIARSSKRASARRTPRSSPARSARGTPAAPSPALLSSARSGGGLTGGLDMLSPLVFDDAASSSGGLGALPGTQQSGVAAASSSVRSRELSRLHNATTMLFLLSLEDAKRERAGAAESAELVDSAPKYAGFAPSGVVPPSMIDMSAEERAQLLELLLRRLNSAGLALAPETTRGSVTLPALT